MRRQLPIGLFHSFTIAPLKRRNNYKSLMTSFKKKKLTTQFKIIFLALQKVPLYSIPVSTHSTSLWFCHHRLVWPIFELYMNGIILWFASFTHHYSAILHYMNIPPKYSSYYCQFVFGLELLWLELPWTLLYKNTCLLWDMDWK